MPRREGYRAASVTHLKEEIGRREREENDQLNSEARNLKKQKEVSQGEMQFRIRGKDIKKLHVRINKI